MNKRIVYFLAVLLLVACENAPVRREESIFQHPEWDETSVRMIREGKIIKGMTQEQVRVAWGRHCLTCQGTRTGGWGESWEYQTQVVFFDTDGRVTRWTVK